jgi:hypothetical protein
MKRILLLSAIFFALVSIAIAQKAGDRNLRDRRAIRSRATSVSVTPRHQTYTPPGLEKSKKPDSVDAQLNKLEHQTATLVTAKPARKTAASPTTTPKTSDASAGNQKTDFNYQPPKGGLTTTQSGRGPNRTKSGLRSRGNGTGHY